MPKPSPPRPARRQRRPRTRRTAGKAFDRLVAIMATLRSPRGCDWDRKQTHRSLRSYLLEETYEAIDAIDRNDLDDLAGELGDVLLQCVFHAALAHEAGRFSIIDVVEGLSQKLVLRHPHVFQADGRRLSAKAWAARHLESNAVREQWAAIKASEQSARGQRPRILAGVPRALPALVRAHKIGGRAASVGFDWKHPADVLAKVDEELAELRQALPEGSARIEEECGDLLFAIANLARHLKLDPEHALMSANDKFSARFDRLEAHLESRGQSVHGATPDDLEAAWQVIKREERSAAATPPRSAASRATSTGARRGRRSRS